MLFRSTAEGRKHPEFRGRIQFAAFQFLQPLREVVDIMTSYPLTPENVALRARMQNCDAALVVGMADTQYVLLREKSAFSMRDGVRRCLATRYVMNGKPSDWSSFTIEW